MHIGLTSRFTNAVRRCLL